LDNASKRERRVGEYSEAYRKKRCDYKIIQTE